LYSYLGRVLSAAEPFKGSNQVSLLDRSGRQRAQHLTCEVEIMVKINLEKVYQMESIGAVTGSLM